MRLVPKYKNPKQPIKRIGKEIKVDNKNGGYEPGSLWRRKKVYSMWDPIGGFDPISWGASFIAGNNAKGEENEYYKAYLGLPHKIGPMSKGSQTNWDYEVEERKKRDGELQSDFYGTTPRMDANIQAIADTLNTGRILRNYDKYKRIQPSLPDKDYIEGIYRTGKEVMNNPGKWVQVKDLRAIKYGYDEHTNETDPLGMLGKFGMRWEPKQESIYVHDTYDFPWTARFATGIPERPREMKIRGRINFNPNKGSLLLRDSLANFISGYPKSITGK